MTNLDPGIRNFYQKQARERLEARMNEGVDDVIPEQPRSHESGISKAGELVGRLATKLNVGVETK